MNRHALCQYAKSAASAADAAAALMRAVTLVPGFGEA